MSAYEKVVPGRLVIVMATFNGEAYLPAQIDSIREQALGDWLLLIRDDGSQDNTIEIIREYVEKDERISLIEDDFGNLGAKACFAELLRYALEAGASHIACSDQDDVWLPLKLERTMHRLIELEGDLGAKTPILVHTDLKVVDDSLSLLSESFMRYENIRNPTDPPITSLLVQNHVVGCSLVANRALVEQALPIPAEARMHDWWLALCAKSMGVLDYLPNTDIKYRQHGGNTLGTDGFSLVLQVASRAWWAKLTKWRMLSHIIIGQGMALRQRIQDRLGASGLTATGRELADAVVCLVKQETIAAAVCAWRKGVRGQNWAATLVFYVSLVLPTKPN